MVALITYSALNGRRVVAYSWTIIYSSTCYFVDLLKIGTLTKPAKQNQRYSPIKKLSSTINDLTLVNGRLVRSLRSNKTSPTIDYCVSSHLGPQAYESARQ